MQIAMKITALSPAARSLMTTIVSIVRVARSKARKRRRTRKRRERQKVSYLRSRWLRESRGYSSS